MKNPELCKTLLEKLLGLFYRDKYYYRKGSEEGIEQGIEQVAKNLINSGYSIDIIANNTGLSEAEILKLKSDE